MNIKNSNIHRENHLESFFIDHFFITSHEKGTYLDAIIAIVILFILAVAVYFYRGSHIQSRSSILSKTIAGYFLITAIMIAVGMYSLKGVFEMKELTQRIYEGPLQAINFSRSAQMHFQLLVNQKLLSDSPNWREDEEITSIYESFKADLEVVKERTREDEARRTIARVEEDIGILFSLPDNESDKKQALLKTIHTNLDNLSEIEAVSGFDYVLNASNKASRIESFNFYTLIALAFFSMIFSVIYGYSLVKPIRRLAGAVKDFEQGKKDIDLIVNSNDEIGQLTRTFSSMMSTVRKRDEELKMHHDNLQEMVEQRTQQLAQEIKEKDSLNKQMQDYTDRLVEAKFDVEEAHKKLKAEEAHIRAIVDNVMEAIITMDQQGRILSFNAGAEKIFRYSKEEAENKNISLLLAQPKNASGTNPIISPFNTDEGDMAKEVAGVDKNNRIFPMSLSVAHINVDGELIYIGLMRDITEQKEKEEELRREKERAEAASQAKSDFLANMSHEIRTPMNGVLGMAGLLLDTYLNAEQHGWASIIKRSGENLMDIINDILDFSKIEAGQLKLEPINFDLYAAVEEVTDVLRLQTHEKNIQLLTRFHCEVPQYVIGDPGRVRQILLNLCGNAIKFTEKGHVLVNVTCMNEGTDHVRLFFEINDTGIGIPEDKLDYIFNKFSQAEESTTRKFGGTGLGLAICKSLTQTMGGSIGVYSKVGKGSTFYFDILLPIGKGENTIDGIPEFNLTSYRGLIVSDYPLNAEILNQYLLEWEISCDVTDDIKQAYQKATAQDAGVSYDFIIIDTSLSSMNGLEFTRSLRAATQLKNNLTVIMCANGVSGTPEELYQAGLDGFLLKPFYPQRLKMLLQFILRARKEGRKLDMLVTKHLLDHLKGDKTTKHSEELHQYTDKRVLVVEDMKVNLMLIIKLLGKHGLRIDSAANGLEAVEMLKNFDYDLVFMDCQMPEMDGFEATREIRIYEETKKKKHTTIVALTADAMTGDREKCLNAGMDDYMNKPVRALQISDMLEKWIGSDRKNVKLN